MKFNWKPLVVISLLLIFTLPEKFSAYHQDSINQSDKLSSQSECEEIYDQFTANEDWFEQLVNPTLATPEEISGRYDLYAQVYDCLGDDIESLSEDEMVIRRLIEYFLIFAGGHQTVESETALILTSFAQSEDSAILKIRDKAKIPPPEGLIFVRFYVSREAMPNLVKQAFTEDDISGATILMRYIAVINKETNLYHEHLLKGYTLPETISHELVHAYINSAVGLKGINLPKWYQEGIAIYFSGSGEDHTVITHDFVASTSSPIEYQQYKTIFEYLKAKLGTKELLARIRQSVEQADPSVLYQDMDIFSDEALATNAQKWQQKRYYVRMGIFCILPLLLVISINLFLSYSVIQCPHCKFRGNKKLFINGCCPECNQPI